MDKRIKLELKNNADRDREVEKGTKGNCPPTPVLSDTPLYSDRNLKKQFYSK